MVDEESLSDAELRKELKQYGETPGPITTSTRLVWIKKLKSLKAGENTLIKSASPKGRSRARRSGSSATPSRSSKLAGFSSGEEDELFSAQRLNSTSKESRSVGKSVQNDRDAVDNEGKVRGRGRESNPEHAPKSTSATYSVKLPNNDIRRKGAGNENDVDGSVSESTVYRSRVLINSKDSARTPKSAQRRSRRRFSPGQAEALLMQDRVNQARANKTTDSTRSLLSNQNHDGNEQEEELYVGFESSRDDFLDWLLQIPVLVILGTILAISIGVGVYVWSQPNTLPEITYLGSGQLKQGVKTKEFLNCLQAEVGAVAGNADCGNGMSRYIHGGDIKKVAIDCFHGQDVDINASIESGLKYALEKAPNAFRIEDLDGNQITTYSSDTHHSKLQITTNNVIKPAWCRIRQALYRILINLLMVLAVLGCAMLTYYTWKRRWMLDDEETREMFILVDHIIDALRKHHEASQHEKELPPYLPIPHVRDMLIPPLEREKKARVWKKAVEFLSSTDSRIRVETQTIAGEDYEVWRWIGVLTPNTQQKHDTPNHLGPDFERGKYWQGPAFAKLEQVVRMPIVTPTPCLKIRCMHGGPTETEGEWDLKIHDALLEKCSTDGANILHIFVDKLSTEGCVYVKCDSLDSAGKVFRSIYANWFDGRLLVVKFVTLKRYHQRFPEALQASAPLEPTGRFPSSLEWFSEDTVD